MTTARDELIDATLEILPDAERPSRWALGVAWQAVAYGAVQDAVELAHLLDLVRAEEPMTLLEVGSWLGGTLWAFGQAAPAGATLISVDRDQSRRRMGRQDQRIELVQGDSQSDVTRDRVADLAYGFDFLFIDADHRLDGVTRDHQLYSALVNRGGVVAFHDICQTNPEHVAAEDVCEVDQLWAQLRPGMAEVWEWSYAGDRFGIGAYRAPLGGVA